MPDFHIDISGAMKGMAAASDKVHRGIALYGQTAALKMEAYAKQHRPWEDHTHHARDTIKGISGWGEISGNHSYSLPTQIGSGQSGDSQFIIGVAGNMPYSPWLELCKFRHKGRLSVLWPAVKALTPETLRGFAAMMNALH